MASCTPGAADEALVTEMVADSAKVWCAVQLAQHTLAAALVPETLAEPRRAAVVLQALKAAVEIGSSLARRVEMGLQVASTLRAARASR